MAQSKTMKRTQRAVDAYRDLRRAVAKLMVLHDKQLRGFELTATQFALLEALLYDGPATLTEIAGKILCTQSNATVVAGNCAKRGWIVLRDHESDRRKLKAHLTPEGRRLIARVFPLYARMVRAQMCAISYAQQELLSRLCQKLEEGDAARFVVEITRGDWEDEEYEDDEEDDEG
jgi:MarR family 2-MHQ and catechol resistance regulon transcriptional repressor